jgi:hypothetical protein
VGAAARLNGSELFVDPVYNAIKVFYRIFGLESAARTTKEKPTSVAGGSKWFYQGLDDYYEKDVSRWDTMERPSLFYDWDLKEDVYLPPSHLLPRD